MIKVGFEKNDSENPIYWCKSGGHPLGLCVLLTIVSIRMEAGFSVKLGDIVSNVCRTNVCGRGGGDEKQGTSAGVVA